MAAAAALTGRLTDVRKVTDSNVTPVKASPKLDVTADIADIESDADLENVADAPQDGQSTGLKVGVGGSGGMPPFTTLKGIGMLITLPGWHPR